LDRDTFNVFWTETLKLLDQAKQVIYKLCTEVVQKKGCVSLAESTSNATTNPLHGLTPQLAYVSLRFAAVPILKFL
jgi:hypothetical protein